ncbi:MAG: OmpA family protein [Gammaproteobacteria bacterium]
MYMEIRSLCLVIGITFLAAACASHSPTESDKDAVSASLARPPERITDSVIKADRDYLAGLQARLQTLADKSWGTNDYHFCKAQAWLDMATNEYSENDRSGVVSAAAVESVRLIAAMEDDAEDIPRDLRVIPTSARVRPDLWEFVETSQGSAAASCASCDLAYLEVQLVWIGHEQNELGWRHALPAQQAADRLRRKITAAEDCIEPPVVAQPAPVEEEPVDVPPEARLPHFVHFAIDSIDLAPASLPRITAIAKVLQERPDLDVRVEGYADRRGSVAYNLDLARRRAEAVRDAIVAHGVYSTRLSVVAIGEDSPRADGDRPIDYARNRRVELVVLNADTSVSLDLAEADLQPESN